MSKRASQLKLCILENGKVVLPELRGLETPPHRPAQAGSEEPFPGDQTDDQELLQLQGPGWGSSQGKQWGKGEGHRRWRQSGLALVGKALKSFLDSFKYLSDFQREGQSCLTTLLQRCRWREVGKRERSINTGEGCTPLRNDRLEAPEGRAPWVQPAEDMVDRCPLSGTVLRGSLSQSTTSSQRNWALLAQRATYLLTCTFHHFLSQSHTLPGVSCLTLQLNDRHLDPSAGICSWGQDLRHQEGA